VIRSMFSAISGLRSHQTMMDVVGNNIANVNSTGFKSSSVVFQDVLSQTLYGAGAPGAALGGTNPAQVGLGTRLAAVTTNFEQGSRQRTGRSTDFAIQGDGFFIVDDGGQNLYTRAGAFSADANGNLVTQQGALVQGWVADINGVVDSTAPLTALQVPVGSLLTPQQTANITLGGNLASAAAVGTSYETSLDTFDAQGTAVQVSFLFTKTADATTLPPGQSGEWTVTATQGIPPTAVALTSNVLTFGTDGELITPATRTIDIAAGAIPNTGAVTVSLGAAGQPGRLTTFGSGASLAALAQDGFAAGSLTSFDVSPQGQLIGTYSNGVSRAIGQLALANFANPEGLERAGDSAFRATQNSGLVQIGTPGTGGRGQLVVGAVEMSNVDLAQEFTNLVLAQRGFQANSRVITSSDEMLQEIVNLKR
jgi:flagellar hook protein FlgE